MSFLTTGKRTVTNNNITETHITKQFVTQQENILASKITPGITPGLMS